MSKAEEFTETVKLTKGMLLSYIPTFYCKRGTVIRVTKKEKEYLIKNKMAVPHKLKKQK